MKGLTEGCVVHYCFHMLSTPELQHRSAVVVRVQNKDIGCVNLTVLSDWINDGPAYGTGTAWKTSVPYSEEPKEHTWHWVEPA